MKNICFLFATLLISAVVQAEGTTLKIDVRCGVLARTSIVDVDSITINSDRLRNYDAGYIPHSQIHEGGFILKVIGNKLFLANLQDDSKISLGTVDQETECSWENLETFSVNQTSNLEINIETGEGQCNSQKIDGRREYTWLAPRTYSFSDRTTKQVATFKAIVAPQPPPNNCQ